MLYKALKLYQKQERLVGMLQHSDDDRSEILE